MLFRLGVVASALLIAGCARDTPLTGSSNAIAPKVALPAFRMNRAISGEVRSVEVHYGANAPDDRLDQIMVSPVRVAVDIQRHRVMSLDVAESSLSSVVTRLRTLAWVEDVAIVAQPFAHATGGFSSRRTSRRARATRFIGRWFSDVVPIGVSLINAPLSQSVLSEVGSGVRVGVMDTGIDTTVADLEGAVKGGTNFVADGYDWYQDHGLHGTDIASIIAAQSNGSGLIGVAPGASLFSIRIMDTSRKATTTTILSGLEWAITDTMKVLNMSLGDCGITHGDLSGTMKTEIADVISAGIVIVAAAGNGSAGTEGCSMHDSLSNYAAQSGVIGVSGVDTMTTVHARIRTGYQSGSHVFISAPDSTTADGSGGGTGLFVGTSAAVPHVVGTVALMLGAGYSASGVSTGLALETQDKPDTTLFAHNDSIGYGVVDAAAVLALTPQIGSFTIEAGSDADCDGNTLFAGETCYISPSYETDIVGRTGWYNIHTTWWDTTTRYPVTVDESSGTTFAFTVGTVDSSYFIEVQGTPHDTVTGRNIRHGTTEEIDWVACPSSEEARQKLHGTLAYSVIRGSRNRSFSFVAAPFSPLASVKAAVAVTRTPTKVRPLVDQICPS
ncbi:MAG TPA: S8 family serine peptidase [Gemmatimonadales bacterium]|nr:S8 family serine peptidase [Gemmatimonadales bacterium]